MAEKSLEASGRADTVRRQKKRSASRHVNKPQSCLIVNPSDPLQSAELLAKRIRTTLHSYGIPVYLYIDDDMHAYVITEDRPIALAWVREHFDWLVAVYAFVHRVGQPMLRPTVTGIDEDIREHLSTLGWIL